KDVTNARKIHPAFYWPSPGYDFIQVAWSMGRGTRAPGEFWQSWLTVHGLTWFFFVWTALKLPRAWQDRPLSAKAETWQARAEAWSQGKPATRSNHRRRTLEKNPVLWLDDRQRLQKTAVWLFLSIFAMVWLWHFSENPRRWFSPAIV